jgi:hypothetical protein
MRKIVWLLIPLLLFVAGVSADTAPTPWSWNTYSGTYNWQVTVIEDQSACGGGVLTNQYTVPIQFNGGTAVMGDVGHGPATGSFTSGNILHIPSRTVADPPGSSTLSAYNVYFTTDCTAFIAKYTWDYSGSDGSCSGSTQLNGASSSGCPGAVTTTATTVTMLPGETPEEIPTIAPASSAYLTPDLAAAGQDLTALTTLRSAQSIADTSPQFAALANLLGQGDGLTSDQRREKIAELDQKTENELQAILVKDPYNYWANMDMAQLKKAQLKKDEYYQYLNTALDNPNVYPETAEELRQIIADQDKMIKWPSPSTSSAVSQADSEIPPIMKNLLGQDLSKIYAESKEKAKEYLFATLCEKRCTFLTDSAREAASTGGGSQ